MQIGGSPAWLDPVDLPAKAQLECKATGRPLNFLLQVYAPVDEEESAFHRTIFVFTTPSQEHIARKGAVRAFRCQLPRDNPFYPPDPPADEDERPPRLSDEDAATSTSRDRWGVVARERGDSTGGADASALLNAFPEMELVVEPEDTAAEKVGVIHHF